MRVSCVGLDNVDVPAGWLAWSVTSFASHLANTAAVQKQNVVLLVLVMEVLCSCVQAIMLFWASGATAQLVYSLV